MREGPAFSGTEEEGSSIDEVPKEKGLFFVSVMTSMYSLRSASVTVSSGATFDGTLAPVTVVADSFRTVLAWGMIPASRLSREEPPFVGADEAADEESRCSGIESVTGAKEKGVPNMSAKPAPPFAAGGSPAVPVSPARSEPAGGAGFGANRGALMRGMV